MALPNIPAPYPTPWVRNPNTGKSMPVIKQPAGTPQIPIKTLGETVDRLSLQGAPKAPTGGTGAVQGIDTQQVPQPLNFIPLDPSMFTTGGGGGGGVNMSAYNALNEQIKAEQQGLADQERGLIEQRRDALIGDIGGAYDDQVAFLEGQESKVQGQAESGKTNVLTQRDQTIQKTQRDAELSRMTARDFYQDMITENRRRARATGSGSGSAFLELSNRLDVQLQRGLTQVGQTEADKIGVANSIADQAVADIERSLQEVMNQISQNRTASLRERDSKINEAKMNASEALLEVDKWLTQTFSSMEMAKLDLQSRARSGGSAPKFNQQAYAAAQAQNQAQIINDLNRQAFELRSSGQYSPQAMQMLFQDALPDLVQHGGYQPNLQQLSGFYMGNQGTPDWLKLIGYGQNPATGELNQQGQEYLNNYLNQYGF